MLVLETAEESWPVKRVRTTNRRFEVELEVEQNGQRVVVTVTPSGTQQAASSQLIIETESPYPAWRRVLVPLEIVPISSQAK